MINSNDSRSFVSGEDLSDCAREPIHQLGLVQSFGCLISVSSDWIVNHASINTEKILGITAADMVGEHFKKFAHAEFIHVVRGRLQLILNEDSVERIFGVEVRLNSTELYDIAIHRSEQSIIMEFERHDAGKRKEATSYIRPMIERIRQSTTTEDLCRSAARQIQALTGFDRVMVYRFASDGTGQVIAENHKFGMDSYKGLRFPESDIPKQARVLYMRNLLRIISDVDDEPSPIYPELSAKGKPIDLSMSSLRAVSPIHLEYLRNMGVKASMSISIIRRQKLWGLFACHNETPRVLSYEIRTAAELFIQLFALVLEQLESDLERKEQDKSKVLHDQLMSQLAEGSSIQDDFETIANNLSSAIACDGMVAWVDGVFKSIGQTPTEEEFLKLAMFLNTAASSRVWSTNHLLKHLPDAERYVNRCAGLLALPISRSPRDYLVLFRREIAQSVQWAGNPEKTSESNSGETRLSPRKSFKAWQEIVRGKSAEWTNTEIRSAEAFRVTLLEVILRMADSASDERARAQHSQELLIAELNHRVRNILNMIQGLINQSKSEFKTVAEFTEVVGSRIHAMARAHDQITKASWVAAPLHQLLMTELGAYIEQSADRMSFSGPNALLQPAAFTTVSLVIHELTTNSAKYGALSNANGSIEIRSTEEHDGSLGISWKEHGGPSVDEPKRRGFGTTVIEHSISFDLNGSAELKFDPDGVTANFVIPAEYIERYIEIEQSMSNEIANESQSVTLPGGAALVVEDNMIIALDAEDHLSELGADQVLVASTVASAMGILEEYEIGFALLDINLGSETSVKIAQHLQNSGTPFIFATGYGEANTLTESFPETPVLQKPYGKEAISRAMACFDKLTSKE